MLVVSVELVFATWQVENRHDHGLCIASCHFILQSLGNSQREYEKQVLLYSIRNQLRFRNNLGELKLTLHW